jgi:hypothetical protein
MLLKKEGAELEPMEIKAPIMMAVVALPGIPRARRGIIAPPVAALLAVSGAATPSIMPVPNFSGCFENLTAVA